MNVYFYASNSLVCMHLCAWHVEVHARLQSIYIENHLNKPDADGQPCDCADWREKLAGGYLNSAPLPLLKMNKSNPTRELPRKHLARLRNLRHPTRQSVISIIPKDMAANVLSRDDARVYPSVG